MTNLFELFDQHGHQLVEVGGAVRDALLGETSQDHDYATDAHPDRICEVLQSASLKVIPIGWDPERGIHFGTIQTIIDDEKVEITTFRTHESYIKGSRKPTVHFGTSLKEDLLRRDFTFNALARDGQGNLIDLFRGERDLRDGIIRTPNDPVQSFTDDPLRILRACRFVARGIGKLHPDTSAAMYQCRELLADLSVERVFEETTKLLLSADPRAGLRVLAMIGGLEVLFPELNAQVDWIGAQGDYHHLSVWEHTMDVVNNAQPKAEVRWAALFHDVAKPECYAEIDGKTTFRDHNKRGAEIWTDVARRLKTSNQFRHSVYMLIYEHQSIPNRTMGKKGVRRLIHRLGDNLDNLFALVEADIKSHHSDVVEADLSDLADMRAKVDTEIGCGGVSNKMPRGTGDVVANALGLKPGPKLGSVMRKLQDMLVDGEITADADFAEVAKSID